MSFVRSAGMAAVATAAAGALALGPALPAQAAPDRPGPGAPAAPGPPDSPGAPGPPAGQPVAALLADLQRLYVRTETAAEKYNATEEQLDRQRVRVRKADRALARARTALREGRGAAARLARQQYRQGGTGLPASVQLLLSPDPLAVLHHGHLLRRAAGDQALTVARLTGGAQRHTALARHAHKALERQRKLTARQKEQRDAVRERLNEVEALLASLSAEELARLRRLEARRTGAAQRELRSSGVLGTSRAPSPAGDRALRYALRQVGKPYVWGAEGPGSFDCSGLTSQAWRAAGQDIPRTSQEQWRHLKRVPLRQLRPGDLVLYFRGATHVGVYAGRGRVVHAPRPGAAVRVSPLAANPVLGAVRPDPAGRPLSGYRPPRLPASPGADTGTDADRGNATPGG